MPVGGGGGEAGWSFLFIESTISGRRGGPDDAFERVEVGRDPIHGSKAP